MMLMFMGALTTTHVCLQVSLLISLCMASLQWGKSGLCGPPLIIVGLSASGDECAQGVIAVQVIALGDLGGLGVSGFQ